MSEVLFARFIVICVLHTARMSNEESSMRNNKERKVVNVKLRKK